MGIIHEAIVAAIKTDIAEGRYKSGDRLPGLKQLQERFACSYGPIRESMIILRHEGVIVTFQGKGMYIL